MGLAALISGGKDSTFAMYRATKLGHDVSYLLSVRTESRESYMFHYPNIEVTELHSQALGIPLLKENSRGDKEKELADLRRLLSRVAGEVDGVVTGALASRYQKERIEALCEQLGLISLAPLWGIDPEKYWEELLENSFEVIVASVACEGLGREWLGRTIDWKPLQELKKLSSKYSFHLAFEGGEAETLVLDMPLFNRRIVVEEAEVEWHGDHGYYLIERASLAEK